MVALSWEGTVALIGDAAQRLADLFAYVDWGARQRDDHRRDAVRQAEEMLERAERRRLADEERAALGYVPPPRRPPAEVRVRAADRRAALAPPRRLWRPRRPT